MKRYEIEYWSKDSVWVKRTIRIDSNIKPTKKNLEELINKSDVEWFDADWNFDTIETLEYDFDNDLRIKEVK